jgi:hypothetical protein
VLYASLGMRYGNLAVGQVGLLESSKVVWNTKRGVAGRDSNPREDYEMIGETLKSNQLR